MPMATQDSGAPGLLRSPGCAGRDAALHCLGCAGLLEAVLLHGRFPLLSPSYGVRHCTWGKPFLWVYPCDGKASFGSSSNFPCSALCDVQPQPICVSGELYPPVLAQCNVTQ